MEGTGFAPWTNSVGEQREGRELVDSGILVKIVSSCCACCSNCPVLLLLEQQQQHNVCAPAVAARAMLLRNRLCRGGVHAPHLHVSSHPPLVTLLLLPISNNSYTRTDMFMEHSFPHVSVEFAFQIQDLDLFYLSLN